MLPLAAHAQQNRIYNGIDISHHNQVLWDSVLADPNITFCYIKASEGIHFLDPMAEYHYLRATIGKLHVGFYHYLRDNVSGKRQYECFKSVLDHNPGYDLIPVIDIERSFNDLEDTARLNTTLRQMVKAFEADFGYLPMIYYCDTKPIHKVISHAERYRKWVPRWRMSSVSTRIDIYQNFVRRISDVPVDFDYCPAIDRIIAPDKLPCYHVDFTFPMATCQHTQPHPPLKKKH